MTNEDKELLLKDLCARLPYGVKCYVPVEDCIMELTGKRLNYFCFHKDVWGIDYSHEFEIVIDPLNDENNNYIVKPYLRPMSSMTEEEYEEFCKTDKLLATLLEINKLGIQGTRECHLMVAKALGERVTEKQNWLNSHHFDFRNLIGRGLAIAVTKKNNPYKE